MDRFVVTTAPASIWFTILDCETDEHVTHEVENRHGVMETMEMRFRHKPSAEYHAAKLNQAETDAKTAKAQA